MTTYESDIKTIDKPQEDVFNLLSDLSNLQNFSDADIDGKEQLETYLQSAEITPDSVTVNITGVGPVALRIIEREPVKTIKFETEQSPVAANAWIQLLPVSENKTKMKITVRAKLPMMIKMMLKGKLTKGVNMVADAISTALNEIE